MGLIRRKIKALKIEHMLSGVAIILSLASFLVSWASYRESHHETLLLHATSSSDYSTVLHSSPFPPAGTGDMITYWEIVLVNNGQQPVSVLKLDIHLLTPSGEIFYSGLIDGVLDDQLRPTEPPWTVDAGKPIKLAVRLRLHIDPSAYAYLQKSFPDGHIPSVRHAQMLLADQKLDFWGDSIAPIRGDSKTIGFTVQSMARQPTVDFVIRTARGTAISDFASWYPSLER